MDGRAVVMVHGFPDGPWTFDHLAAAAVDAGFRVIRPWLRGYPPTDVPSGRTVALPDLVADLEGLVSALDLTRPLLVGHDWGAVIGWTSAGQPDPLWSGFVALSIPPPPVQMAAARNPVQALYRSGYMTWMQVPGAERILPLIIRRLYRRWSPGWSVAPEHLDRVLAMLADPAAARAVVGYYRWIVPATLRGRYPAVRDVPQIPVRYLHGADDTCFPAAVAQRSRRLLPDDAVRVVPEAGHFLHLEQPEVVTADIMRFLLACGKG